MLGLMAAGIGAIFLWLDRRTPSSRALGASLIAQGTALFLNGFETFGGLSISQGADLTSDALTAIAIVCGVEWGRRIGAGAGGRAARAANVLFRVAQGLVLLYWALGVGYTLLFPELATTEGAGVVTARGVEFAVFGPVLGSAMLLAGIAILLLLLVGVDRAEAVRLRALMFAAPFLLSGIVLRGIPMAVLMTIGLLLYLSGSIRYLVIQHERGQFMSRFVSPQLARAARQPGVDVLRRERRRVTVLACDLRGFTAYARREESARVVDLLERYYTITGAIAAAHGGTVKDHAGDGVLILLGAPLPLPDAEQRAAAMALELLGRVGTLLRESGTELGAAAGIATGEVTVGAIQGAGRMEYVAVGNAVNLAARLCGRAGDGEVLADAETVSALAKNGGIRSESRAAEALKGYPEPVPVFALVAC